MELKYVAFIDEIFFLSLLAVYFVIHLILFVWLKKAHNIRRVLIERDDDYHKRVFELCKKNSIMDNVIEEKDHQAGIAQQRSPAPFPKFADEIDTKFENNKKKCNSFKSRFSQLVNSVNLDTLEKNCNL